MIDALRTASDAVLSIICTLAVFGAASVTCGLVLVAAMLRVANQASVEAQQDTADWEARHRAPVRDEDIDVEACASWP